MASLISQDTIEAVHNMSDIVSIVGEYTKLTKRSGNDWWGCCPFHNEKTASFHVDGDKKFYYCFGCHASGDVIKFVTETEKISYADAVRSLAKRAGIEVTYSGGDIPERPKDDGIKDLYIDLYERTATLFHYLLTQTPGGKDALSYITGRGITAETIAAFKLGYAPADRSWLKKFLRGKNFSDTFLAESGLFSKNYPDTAFFSDRLMFPIFNRRGQCCAFGGRLLHGDGPKYLNSGDLIQYKKGETLYAFNFAKNKIREEKKVIFCEGYMDCIAYHQCGITYAVAPLGTALTEEQLRIVRGFADTILLSFDSDKAGEAATVRAIIMCRSFDFTVKIIRLSEGKDPAEIMASYGAETLTNDVNNAILDSNFLLSKLGSDFAVDTPEGKTKASLEFFRYVDALRSDIQKESCLEQLCQAFNLKPEAVKRDFENREQARDRLKNRQQSSTGRQNSDISLNAELRTVLAVIAELDLYTVMRAEIAVDDFEDPLAKKLFIILEDCFREKTVSIGGILNRCDDEELGRMITRVISSGEFSRNGKRIVEDGIKLIKRNALERKRSALMSRIRLFNPATESDRTQLESLLAEKMKLDSELKQ
ncbi:DNA primase [Treponema sp. Marseille-Q4523]|uniref:DNA primase n=1 Tax=Treponema sp. Marseille-Q4523 TaxID=2810610 RepID=UPI001961202B|nr:DNA primase [Treponema sp. Marseille-Q4523]MBM7022281.1 DNA primase [Treponema sp. Marseille-Q4523]